MAFRQQQILRAYPLGHQWTIKCCPDELVHDHVYVSPMFTNGSSADQYQTMVCFDGQVFCGLAMQWPMRSAAKAAAHTINSCGFLACTLLR